MPDPYADPAASLAILDRLREEHPEDPQYLVATAREASALGTLAETREDRRRYLRRAVEAARTAVALAPDRAETRYWLAASLGLLADQEGVRAKISLALEAHRQARETLRLDSLHGGGHHILGRLHAGARRLSWASRIIARGLGLGDILEEASWESAERHMRWAVERDPGQLVHFYELGKLLVEERGGREEGLALLEDLAKRVPRHPVDSLYSDRAGRALKRYRGG